MASTGTHELDNTWKVIHSGTAGDLLVQLQHTEPAEIVVKEGAAPATDLAPKGIRLTHDDIGSLSINGLTATDVVYGRVRDEGDTSLVGWLLIPTV